MRSLTNVLDEELKLYLLSMLQMQEETQHAGQMVMQDEVARMLRSNVSWQGEAQDWVIGVIFFTCIVALGLVDL